MSRGQKVWDVFFPLVALLVTTIIATTIVLIVTTVISIRTLSVSGDQSALFNLSGTASLIATMLANVGAVVFLRRAYRIDEMRFFADRKAADPLVLIFSMLFAMAASNLLEFGILISGIQRIFPLYERIAQVAFEGQSRWLLLLAVVIIGPFAEEFIFRGLVYRRIRAHLGVPAGIVLSSLLFGIWHLNMVQFLFAFALGLFFAWIYEQTKTLLVPFLGHALANGWSLLLSELVESGRVSDAGYVRILCAEAIVAAVCLLFFISKRRRRSLEKA